MSRACLQEDKFDVNLYVFYRYWINDDLSKYGFEHRGFYRRHRDWDTRACESNGGKAFDDPASDVYLKSYAKRLTAVTAFMKKHHAGQRFYLTNIQAFRLDPTQVRNWPDDLWLFPYYVNQRFVPYDARPGGPAAAWSTTRGD